MAPIRRHLSDTDYADPERGAILVMALVFLIVGSLLAVGLADLATTNLADTTAYRSLSNLDYAASGAVEGAIQQVRYRGACEAFPKTGTLQLSGNQYVFVTCQGTPITASVDVTGSATTLHSPSVPFSQADATTHQAVNGAPGAGTAKLPGLTTISAVSADGTTAEISARALSSGTVTVGTAFQRLYTFYACVFQSAPASPSCGPATNPAPEVTASVLFEDLKPATSAGNPPVPVTGYGMQVVSWLVADANN